MTVATLDVRALSTSLEASAPKKLAACLFYVDNYSSISIIRNASFKPFFLPSSVAYFKYFVNGFKKMFPFLRDCKCPTSYVIVNVLVLAEVKYFFMCGCAFKILKEQQ